MMESPQDVHPGLFFSGFVANKQMPNMTQNKFCLIAEHLVFVEEIPQANILFFLQIN